jgi:hypothetical protein
MYAVYTQIGHANTENDRVDQGRSSEVIRDTVMPPSSSSKVITVLSAITKAVLESGLSS